MTRKTLEQIWSQGAQKLFKQGANMTEEDEAFNDIERQAKQRMEAVKVLMRKALANELYDSGYKDGRSDTIEEVAQHIEKLTGFGQDTVSSLAIYIREMKK